MADRFDDSFAEAEQLFTDKHYMEALRYYRKAAYGGHAPSQCRMGEIYYRGLGVKTHPIEAINWLKQSSEAGYDQATYLLAHLYEHCFGWDAYGGQAFQLYAKAAERDHPAACAALGLCYCTWAFSNCGEQGLLSSCSAWISHCQGFSS